MYTSWFGLAIVIGMVILIDGIRDYLTDHFDW